LYTGAADVAAVTGDKGYVQAMKTVWEDVVNRNMYITGGIGSSGRNEGFSVDYDLPNEQAYCETCASVGMVFWNQRMNLLTGEGKYADVLERSLYNGALDGLSLSGDRFFYGNPLASSGQHGRSEWFGTACCPSNISRLVESLGDYVYARSADAIWVNLFVGSTTTIPLKSGKVQLTQQTRYPWEGTVQIAVSPERKMKFPLRVRIPGWAQNQPTPGNIYRFADAGPEAPTLLVNGKPVAAPPQNGYAVIEREWKKGDVVALSLPMPVRRIAATDSVKANQNRVALQRGPLVYCVEHVDNDGKAMNVIVPDGVGFTPAYRADLLGGVVALQAETPVVTISADGASVTTVPKKITAIPYYAWANRGKGQMQVWLPRKAGEVKVSAE
ncbi:MAG: glycoside hydrolase family 127 protein, partial [Cytophagales bacterium]|nr:glycoside hydrolase family 127 protein [Cytophagales bacterium]